MAKSILRAIFDSIMAYLAGKNIETSSYEIRKGKIDNLVLTVEKNWLRITKNEIREHILEFLEIITEAYEKEKYLFFSYY